MVDLDDLERLLREASERPWTAVRGERHRGGSVVRTSEMWRHRPHGDTVLPTFVGEVGSDEDAAAIVALVNAAPDLLAELRRLRRVEVAARDVCEGAAEACAPRTAPTVRRSAVDVTWARIERLHAALDEVP